MLINIYLLHTIEFSVCHVPWYMFYVLYLLFCAVAVCHLRIHYFFSIIATYFLAFSSHSFHLILLQHTLKKTFSGAISLFIFIWCVTNVIIRCIILQHTYKVQTVYALSGMAAKKTNIPTGLCWSYAIFLLQAQRRIFHRTEAQKNQVCFLSIDSSNHSYLPIHRALGLTSGKKMPISSSLFWLLTACRFGLIWNLYVYKFEWDFFSFFCEICCVEMRMWAQE